MRMEPVHIRHESMAPLCGGVGGTIRLEHYRETPARHLAALVLCAACEAKAEEAK